VTPSDVRNETVSAVEVMVKLSSSSMETMKDVPLALAIPLGVRMP